MAEGARLESVFRGNSNVGSNPTLSAMLFKTNDLTWQFSRPCFVFRMTDMQFHKPQCVPLRLKATSWESVFRLGEGGIWKDQVGA